MNRVDVDFFKQAVQTIKKESSSDIVARCPICGDSKFNKNKARLHLYEKNGKTFVNCFNGDCPCQNKTVYTFLRDFYPHLLHQYKVLRFEDKISEFSNLDAINEMVKNDFNISKPSETQDFEVDLTQYFKPFNDLCGEYLKSRSINYTEDFGKWYYGDKDLNIDNKLYKTSDCIIIPMYTKNQMYGFYSRKLKVKEFYTYIHPKAVGYKVWNWFNINKEEPVYIFEGIFDALSAYQCGIKNVIACMGAKLPDERLKELRDPIFCLDLDRTGLKNMLEYSKHYKVCAFESHYKDYNEMLKSGLDVKSLIESNIKHGISARIYIHSLL